MREIFKDQTSLPDGSYIQRSSWDGKSTGVDQEQYVTVLAEFSSKEADQAFLLNDLRAGTLAPGLYFRVEMFQRPTPPGVNDTKPAPVFKVDIPIGQSSTPNQASPEAMKLTAFSAKNQSMRVSLYNPTKSDLSAFAPISVQFRKNLVDVRA